MLDPRNLPALIVASVLGIVAFVLLWLWAGWSPLLAWLVGWSVPAFALYGVDKRQARSGGWRIPENLLHGVALIGGVAGAVGGQTGVPTQNAEANVLGVLVLASVIWAAIAIWALRG